MSKTFLALIVGCSLFSPSLVSSQVIENDFFYLIRNCQVTVGFLPSPSEKPTNRACGRIVKPYIERSEYFASINEVALASGNQVELKCRNDGHDCFTRNDLDAKTRALMCSAKLSIDIAPSSLSGSAAEKFVLAMRTEQSKCTPNTGSSSGPGPGPERSNGRQLCEAQKKTCTAGCGNPRYWNGSQYVDNQNWSRCTSTCDSITCN